MGFFDFGRKKARMLELQKIIAPEVSNNLSEKDLMRLADQIVNNNMRIIAESQKILETTKNIDTFNSRMNIVEKAVNETKCILPFIKTSVSVEEFERTFSSEKQSLEWKLKSRLNEEIRKYSNPYYETIPKIESAWSVIANLGAYNGDDAKTFEKMCFQSIKLFDKYAQKSIDLNLQNGLPHHIPAYVRLAMLYEKQENYQKAIDICVDAIKKGAYEDKSNGKMYGRLARMIKKSGIQVDNEILSLTQN